MSYTIYIHPGGSAGIDRITVNGTPTDFSRIKVAFGPEGSITDASPANPLPVREPVNGNALGKGGITSASSSTMVVAANASRTSVEVSNGGDNGIWLAFGTTAVAGHGTYLPSKSTGVWATTAQVNCILESGGAAGAVGYTQW